MTAPSLARQTVIGASWLVLWRFITRILGFISTLILARLLMPADFGLVAMASTFAAAIDSLSELGIQDALVRHPSNDRKLYNTAFTLQIGRALLTAAVIALGAPIAAAWFNEPRLEALLLVLAAISLISGVENIGVVDFRRDMRFDMQFRFLAIPRLLQLAVTIPLAIATGSYWALILGTAMSKLTYTVMSYMLHSYRPWLSLVGWRELTGFSIWIWVTSLVKLVWDRCDPFILGPALGPGGLGVYLLALEMAILPVSELIAPAASALFAGFASAQRQGSAMIDRSLSVSTTLLLVILPVVVSVSCASGHVVAALLGPKWEAARPLIAILAWQCVFSPVCYVANAVLVASGHVRHNFVCYVVMSVVKVAALLAVTAVTDRLDIVAYVLVALIALEALTYIVLLKSVAEVRVRPVLGGLVRAALAGALATYVLYEAGFAWRSVEMGSWAALLTCALIGIIALAVFWPVHLLLWWLSGRPAGSEAILLNFLTMHLRPMIAGKLTRQASS